MTFVLFVAYAILVCSVGAALILLITAAGDDLRGNTKGAFVYAILAVVGVVVVALSAVRVDRHVRGHYDPPPINPWNVPLELEE